MDARTILLGVIGHPIGHSLSPAIHNAAFRKLGLNCAYGAFDVRDVRGALRGVRALGLRGLSVTVPHKVSVMRGLDRVDALAKRIGAVNTVVNNRGRLVGYNTDARGALLALRERVNPAGKKVVIVGSGGAARAVAFAMLAAGKARELRLIGVIENQVRNLANRLAQSAGKRNVWWGLSGTRSFWQFVPDADILINCSPVGMTPKVSATPVPALYLHPRLVVFDIVYRPKMTKLLRDARRKGCRIIHGERMFLFQAVEQFRLWTGKRPPLAVMAKVLSAALAGRKR